MFDNGCPWQWPSFQTLATHRRDRRRQVGGRAHLQRPFPFLELIPPLSHDEPVPDLLRQKVPTERE